MRFRSTPPDPSPSRGPLTLRHTTRRDSSGRHELGQNFLVDRHTVASIADAVPREPALPVLELGAGDGALSGALAAAGHAVTAVEFDVRRADVLRRRCPDVTVVEADMLSVHVDTAHHVVSNVPFGITTALLRHLLGQGAWQTAVLLVQWEVARKRAAVGGTTLLTAQWWPWIEFDLLRRVPARSFRPVPSVDGGVLILRRRASPLVPRCERESYQQLVRRTFDRGGPDSRTRARDLDAQQWAALHRARRTRRRAGP